MRIVYTRTRTIVETGETEIPDDTPHLDEYLKILAIGVHSPMSIDPIPSEWRKTRESVEFTGKPSRAS